MKLTKVNVVLDKKQIIWLNKQARREVKSRSCYLRDMIRFHMNNTLPTNKNSDA